MVRWSESSQVADVMQRNPRASGSTSRKGKTSDNSEFRPQRMALIVLFGSLTYMSAHNLFPLYIIRCAERSSPRTSDGDSASATRRFPVRQFDNYSIPDSPDAVRQSQTSCKGWSRRRRVGGSPDRSRGLERQVEGGASIRATARYVLDDVRLLEPDYQIPWLVLLPTQRNSRTHRRLTCCVRRIDQTNISSACKWP